MTRAGELLLLSREHHTALVLARDCGRVTDEAAAGVLARIHAHHLDTLVAHFETEEALLQRARDVVPAELAERLATDHAWLRAWYEVHPTLPDAAAAKAHLAADIAAYGQRLSEHVRFEERQLWPHLQPFA